MSVVFIFVDIVVVVVVVVVVAARTVDGGADDAENDLGPWQDCDLRGKRHKTIKPP